LKAALCGFAVAIALLPAGAWSAGVQFAAPAGNAPAGRLREATYDAVLPSGRIVTPLGVSTVTGVNAQGLALSPDGRFAIVSHAAARTGEARSSVDPQALGGSSLAAVDLTTMRVAGRFAYPGESYAGGVAVVADPRFPQRDVIVAAGDSGACAYVLDLDANGRITPDLQHILPLGASSLTASIRPGLPTSLVAAPDGRRIYALDAESNGVTAIDPAARAVSGAKVPVGYEPFGAAIAGERLLVASEGLMRYSGVPAPRLAPPFAPPPADPLRASALSAVGLAAGGDPVPDAPAPALAMDVTPDGVRIVGGAHPTSIAVTPDGAFAFVAMTNVDRIASVELGATPRVVGGTELRLFDRGPYGSQPAALALSRDGTRLYAALAGLNAVAVLDSRDPLHLHRLGLLPTGWLPTALALGPDDRTLYVLNTNGFGHDGAAVWSTLQKIDLAPVTLSAATLTALKNTRTVSRAAPRYPRGLRDVVVVVEEQKTFDAMLGDLGYGPADPGDVRFGAGVTPNLHALARRYALAGNIFADAQESDAAHQWITGGIATAYARRRSGEDPEAYPRAGYIFNNLARHHMSFRDYGELVRVAGYDDGAAADARVDDPAFAGIDDRRAPTRGLGGRYTLDVPALAALAGHIDGNYPGWNPRIRDERRAREFIHDYGALVSAGRQPRYTQIWLPADAAAGGPDAPPAAEEVADGDRALGAIVAYLSRLAGWKHMAIFVLSAAARGSPDHVDASRTYALVVSPFARRRYVGMRHLSTLSVLKTAQQILGLPPLALGDLLATDMSDFFGDRPDVRPFAALPVAPQTASLTRR
jgi:YVTN family beta-propeller protein